MFVGKSSPGGGQSRLFQRYAAAIAAVKHTQRVLPHGAANLTGGPSDKHERVQALWEEAKHNTEIASADMRRRTEIGSQLARKHGVGNFGEQASVAYMYLIERITSAMLPVSFCLIPKSKEGNHSFVVIGPCQAGRKETVLQWGPEAVICDPWLCQAWTRTLSAKELNEQPLYHQTGAYTPSRFVKCADKAFPGWTKVRSSIATFRGKIPSANPAGTHGSRSAFARTHGCYTPLRHPQTTHAA